MADLELIPRWPREAIGALARLFRQLQDIDVFVEDKGDEVFYLEVLRRVAPEGVRIESVFPLDGRPSVLAACASHDFSARRALFIVDGDFPFVRGEEEMLPPGAVRIPAYCIENLLVCPCAAVEILYEECGKSSREDLADDLKWDVWIQDVATPLVELFVWFAVSNSLDPTTATVAEGLGRLLTQAKKKAPQAVEIAKITAACQKLRQGLVSAHGESAVKAVEQCVRKRLDALDRPQDIVSGKDFLLPALHLHLMCVGKINVKRKSLRMRLARHCLTASWKPLAEALHVAAAGKVPVALCEPA